MKTTLKARLEETIQKWIDDNCEKNDWVSCYVTDDLAESMTNSAAQVLIAMEAHEKYLEQENLLS